MLAVKIGLSESLKAMAVSGAVAMLEWRHKPVGGNFCLLPFW
jgi:hypothetical protein